MDPSPNGNDGGVTDAAAGYDAESGVVPIPDCSAGQEGLVGPLETGTVWGSGGLSGPSGWEFSVELVSANANSEMGLVLLGGPGSLDDGLPHKCHGVIQSVDAEHTWFCAGGTLTAVGQNHEANLTDLSRLGACPGQPAQGELTWCNYFVSPKDGGIAADCNASGARITGKLGSQTVDVATNEFLSVGASKMPISNAFLQADGLCVLKYSTNGGAHGVVRFPEDSKLPGLIVCFGEGSSAFADGNIQRFVLRSLSTLGSCPGSPIEGKEIGCL